MGYGMCVHAMPGDMGLILLLYIIMHLTSLSSYYDTDNVICNYNTTHLIPTIHNNTMEKLFVFV